MSHPPKPEFKVNCVMCGHNSFAATADTLKELVEIVSLHIRQVKERDYEPHKEYFERYPGTMDLMPSLENPDNTTAILASPLFAWSIDRLVPFNKIVEVAQIAPFPRLDQPMAAR